MVAYLICARCSCKSCSLPKKKRFSVQVDLVIIEEIKYETRINLNEARTWIYLKMDSGQDHRGLCTILR